MATLDAKRLTQDLIARLEADAADEHELEVQLTQVQIAMLTRINAPHPSGQNLVQRNQRAVQNAGAKTVLEARAAAAGTTYAQLADDAAKVLGVRTEAVEPLQMLAVAPGATPAAVVTIPIPVPVPAPKTA